MIDPAYFTRLPPARGESPDDARARLARQVEIHRDQRRAAKARALAQGYPGVTADTPVEPPFATWDCAGVCPLHRFLMAEHAAAEAERWGGMAVAAE